jgi:UDP-N-acetylglucosamine:LPS N-acetylglucosamine transferase
MSVHPLWVAAGVDAHLAMHKIPADQARRFGASGITITAPVVPTRFAEVSTCPREVARAMFELPAGGRVALVLAGSWGVGEIIQTTTDVAESKLATPVVVCGHNEELRRRLRETGIGVALGWIRDMPTLLRAADVVIHNAGGLSCMEALAAGVPVLTYRPLSGHGRTNVDALSQAGLVAHADDAEGLHQLLGEVLSPGFSSVASGSVRALWTKPDAATAIAHLAGWRCEIGDGSGSPSHPELRRT